MHAMQVSCLPVPLLYLGWIETWMKSHFQTLVSNNTTCGLYSMVLKLSAGVDWEHKKQVYTSSLCRSERFAGVAPLTNIWA